MNTLGSIAALILRMSQRMIVRVTQDLLWCCFLYTFDAADEEDSVYFGVRGVIIDST